MTSPGAMRRKVGHRIAETLLWCGAGLGVVSIASALAALSFGFVPLVFTSGSMAPEIPTGSLGLARSVPADELRSGDVVSVTGVDGTRVTHRIVTTEAQSDGVVLTLQGDTNPNPDEETYRVREVDRVLVTAPYLGRILMFLTGPWGMFLGGLAAAALLFWAFRRRPPEETGADDAAGEPPVLRVRPAAGRGDRRADRKLARASATLVAVGVPSLLLVTTGSGTASYFTDDARVDTTGFKTHRVLQPADVTCSSSGTTGALTVGTTPLPDQRYSYWARAFDDAGVAVSGYRQLSGSPAQAEFSISDFTPELDVSRTYALRVYSRIGAPGATGTAGWESAVYRRTWFSRAGTTLACGEAVMAPVIVFTQPVDGFDGSRRALLDLVGAGCAEHGTGDPAICGTATDPNGSVVSLQYILQRSSFWGTYCWTGSGYPAFGSCAYRNATRNASENRWSIAGDAFQGITTWTYKLTVKATDNLGAVTERSITFRVSPN